MRGSYTLPFPFPSHFTRSRLGVSVFLEAPGRLDVGEVGVGGKVFVGRVSGITRGPKVLCHRVQNGRDQKRRCTGLRFLCDPG